MYAHGTINGVFNSSINEMNEIILHCLNYPGFCQGFWLPSNTFVGNHFLRILGSAGKVHPQEKFGQVLGSSSALKRIAAKTAGNLWETSNLLVIPQEICFYLFKKIMNFNAFQDDKKMNVRK